MDLVERMPSRFPGNKKLLADLSLAQFDLKKEITVTSDTRNYGTGAVILHKF